jgi:hypothetical protein
MVEENVDDVLDTVTHQVTAPSACGHCITNYRGVLTVISVREADQQRHGLLVQARSGSGTCV